MKSWNQLASKIAPVHKTRYIFFSIYSFLGISFFIFFSHLSFLSIPILLIRSGIGSLLYFQFFESDKIGDKIKVEMKPSKKVLLVLTLVLLIFFIKNPLIWLVPVVVIIMFLSYKSSLDLYKNRRYFNPREYINSSSGLIGLLIAAVLGGLCYVRFDKIDINCDDLNKSFMKILAGKNTDPEKQEKILAGGSLFFGNFSSGENSNLTGQTLKGNISLSGTRNLIDKVLPTLPASNPFYNTMESLKSGLSTTMDQNKNLSSGICKNTLQNLKTNYENPQIRAFVMLGLSLLVLPFAKLTVMIVNIFFTILFYIFLKIKIFKKKVENTDREMIYG